MTETERQRFHELRQRELSGSTLTGDESRELEGYIAVLDAEEASLLKASNQERDAKIGALDEQIARMRSLVARRESLVEYLRRIAQEVDTERESIDTAFRQLVENMDVVAGAVRASH